MLIERGQSWHPFIILLKSKEAEINFFMLWLILDLRPANENHRYIVTPSLIGWSQT